MINPQKTSIAMLVFTAMLLSQGLAPVRAETVTDVPPPQPRIERPPPHRDGYVWAPGYWDWNGRFYRWTSGSWISEHRGHWVADHWDQLGNQWHYVRGHWEQ